MTTTNPVTPRDTHALRFLVLQKQLARRFRAALPDHVRDEMGQVTQHQIEAMALISKSGPITMGELATAMGSASMSSMTQLADRLVKLGFVERRADENDRRVVRLVLTPEATDAVKTFVSAHQRSITEAFDAFDDEELATFMRLVEKLAGSGADCAVVRPS